MRQAFAASIALTGLAFAAQAQEGFDLASRAKALAPSASMAGLPGARQFLPPAEWAAPPPAVDVLASRAIDPRRPRADCEITATDICFDMRERKPVYRGVREYMPTVDGLKPESVSLKREGVVFKYSFK
jgi:hypothetical protein